jgi:hypothetical protein
MCQQMQKRFSFKLICDVNNYAAKQAPLALKSTDLLFSNSRSGSSLVTPDPPLVLLYLSLSLFPVTLLRPKARSGVTPLLSLAFTLAPLDIKILAALILPTLTAI